MKPLEEDLTEIINGVEVLMTFLRTNNPMSNCSEHDLLY